MLVTLNDPKGHSLVVGLVRCNLSNICAAFYKISTDSVLARSLGDSWLLVSARNDSVSTHDMHLAAIDKDSHEMWKL